MRGRTGPFINKKILQRPENELLITGLCRGVLKQVCLSFELGDQASDGSFCVAKEHAGIVIKEQGVLNTGKARVHRSLENNNRFSTMNLDDRHAVDRA